MISSLMGVFFAVGVVDAVRNNWGEAVFYLGVGTLILGWLLYQRLRVIVGPAPAQVRLGHSGFAQRDGAGEVELVSWHRAQKINFHATTAGRWRLTIAGARSLSEGVTDLVGIEFECEEQQGAELRTRIEEWLKTEVLVLAMREKEREAKCANTLAPSKLGG